MTSIQKICILINHSKMKMRPVDVKSNTYIDFGVRNNEKDSKCKAGDHVRISKYKKKFAKVFVVEKVKNIVPYTYVLQKTNQR